MKKNQEIYLPSHILYKIDQYRWNDRIKLLNSEYLTLFVEKDGILHIRQNYLDKDSISRHDVDHKVVFNFRYSNYPNYWMGISQLHRLSNGKYSHQNEDYVIIDRKTRQIKEFVKYPLPNRYFFTSGLNYLKGHREFTEGAVQDIYNIY